MKLTCNTGQNVVLAPDDFWQIQLKSKVEAAVLKKLPGDKYIRDEAFAVVNVNDRAEDDPELFFPDCDIEWYAIEKQLVDWSYLYRSGKRLKVKMELTYTLSEAAIEEEARNRQGTKSQHAELAAQTLRDRAAGISQVWRDVFPIFECPQTDCNVGLWCMYDAQTKKRVRVEMDHMQQIRDYVEAGGTVRSHDDVPPHIRDQIMQRA